MTEEIEEKCDDSQYRLLHLSNISLIPADIVSVYWEMNQKFAGKVVTRIRTSYEVFILESDSPCYKKDIEALKKATEKLA